MLYLLSGLQVGFQSLPFSITMITLLLSLFFTMMMVVAMVMMIIVTIILFKRQVIAAGEDGYIWRYDYIDDATLAEWAKWKPTN